MDYCKLGQLTNLVNLSVLADKLESGKAPDYWNPLQALVFPRNTFEL
jgi:hypothetical protein